MICVHSAPPDRRCVASCSMLVHRSLQNEFVIGDFAEFSADIEKIYAECEANTAGKACHTLCRRLRTLYDRALC